MIDQEVSGGGEIDTPRSIGGYRDAILLKLAARALRNVSSGRLELTLPSGCSAMIGGDGPIEADLQLCSFALVRRALRRGMLGFAESYIAGDIETRNLGSVFRFFLDNYDNFEAAGRGWFKPRIQERIAHRMRRNSRKGSRRNIAAHYDLGNDFYTQWLDPGMTYSSALFEDATLSLAEAQDAKYDRILAELDVRPGDRVLEIGCGWGGMAEALVRAGAHVTAITLSHEQHAHATRRLASLDGPGGAEVRLQDYRDVIGQFDRIVSVEMIEAVGEEHWPVYFGKLKACLAPGGRAVLQAITISPDHFENYRRHPDFIQRYIFPGGMLPTRDHMHHHAETAGLGFATAITFGSDYSETLRRWRASFEKSWPRISALGFDERFQRMWLYYLTYCEVGFEKGMIDVGLYTLDQQGCRKPSKSRSAA